MFEQTIVGLDIGSWSVKFVEMEAGLRGAHFTRFDELMLPDGVSPEELEATVQLFAQQRSINTDFLVSEQDDVINGVAIVIYEAGYTNEICAYVDKLFIHREFRGLGASDDLLEAVLEACSNRQAKLVFASATAGMGERIEKLYVRLFERHGFSVLGRIIMRAL